MARISFFSTSAGFFSGTLAQPSGPKFGASFFSLSPTPFSFTCQDVSPLRDERFQMKRYRANGMRDASCGWCEKEPKRNDSAKWVRIFGNCRLRGLIYSNTLFYGLFFGGCRKEKTVLPRPNFHATKATKRYILKCLERSLIRIAHGFEVKLL